MNNSKTVDEYIENAPIQIQEKLYKLRKLINNIVPTVEEKISYGMPYYGYKGRLVYFAHAKHHIGLYIPPPIIENHKEELKDYRTSKSAVQIPLDQELPVALITKLIKARIKHNEEQSFKK